MYNTNLYIDAHSYNMSHMRAPLSTPGIRTAKWHGPRCASFESFSLEAVLVLMTVAGSGLYC